VTTLAMATVLSLAAQCAPGVAPDTVAAIAQAESGLEPLAIHDNTVQRTFQPANLPEAIALATDLIVAQHHSVDLGLMQVNSANFATLGLSIANAFDACHSIEAGGHVLSSVYQRALRGALSAYNTGDPQRGVSNGYVSRVEHAALSVPSISPGASAPPAQPHTSPPTPAAAGWDVFAQSGGTQFVFTGR
jgi:type IV secretion system protein VirB1